MSAIDAPDWQRIVQAQEAGLSEDAPDWQRVVTGPGGGTINITGSPSLLSLYASLGYIGCPLWPLGAQNGQSQNTGVVYLEAFQALFTGPAHSVSLAVRTGQTLTANENFVGIYDFGQATAGTMTLLAQSAAGAADSIWAVSSRSFPVPLSTNPTLTVGQTYVVATLCNGNIMNSFGPGQASAFVANPLAAFPLFSSFGPGHTTLPSTIAFSGVTLTTVVSYLFIA